MAELGRSLREGLVHGVGLASVLAVVTPVWDLLVQTSGLWFPLVGVISGPIASNVPAIPTGLATQVLVIAAVLYGATLLDQLLDRLETES